MYYYSFYSFLQLQLQLQMDFLYSGTWESYLISIPVDGRLTRFVNEEKITLVLVLLVCWYYVVESGIMDMNVL